MKRTRSLSYTFAALLIGLVGCDGGNSGNMIAPNRTGMNLVASPTVATTGDPVSFTV